jgi:spore germination cell wall hydrolase CwlJ-like protein
MPEGTLSRAPGASWWSTLLWALILAGIPALVAHLSLPLGAADGQGARMRTVEAVRPPPTPPPAVAPVEVMHIAPATARTINAAVPFSAGPNPAARPFRFAGTGEVRDRAIDCLASAQFYEAGDDPGGQRAVAQVVLNRLRHPAFPKTVCGVVFQGSERATGCQFTFTCDGSLARIPSEAAWGRARALASKMLSGRTDARVGYATHYHTDWVVPYWSQSLDKIAAVDTHLFFRWKGWWGTPPAFRGSREGTEPAIAKLAARSPAHRSASGAAGALAGSDALPPPPDFSDLGRPAMAIGRDRIGERFGPGRLAALNSTGDAFVMLLDRGADPASFERLARELCSGRRDCRLLGWTRVRDVPSAFPIDEDSLRSMSYAYMRVADAELERSLFNCLEYPDQPKNRCMRERTPVSGGTKPRTGTEVVRLPG